MEIYEGIDCIGEMYFYDLLNPVQITLTTKNSWYPITGLTVGCCKDMIDNASSGEFDIVYDGTYIFNGCATIFPGAGAIITFALFVNDVMQENIITAISFKNNQDRKSFSGSGILKLRTDDVVNVKAMSDTDAITLSMTNINLMLHRTDRRA